MARSSILTLLGSDTLLLLVYRRNGDMKIFEKRTSDDGECDNYGLLGCDAVFKKDLAYSLCIPPLN
jgi:hypothetical protein